MSLKRIVFILIIMGITYGVTTVSHRSETIPPVQSFSKFPMQLGEWHGRRSSLSDEVYNVLGVEDYILADYTRNPRYRVNLYLGFYQSQKEGDLIHSPKNCMPGAGWSIKTVSRQTLEGESGAAPMEVASLLIQRGKEQQVVLYWFQSRGRVIASEYMQKIWLVVDSITRQRTDGSFVRLISPVVTSEAETLDTLKGFAKELRPHLEAFIPS